MKINNGMIQAFLRRTGKGIMDYGSTEECLKEFAEYVNNLKGEVE